MLSGMLFDIREFTIHDGPGLRTTVFLKGCPAGLHVVPQSRRTILPNPNACAAPPANAWPAKRLPPPTWLSCSSARPPSCAPMKVGSLFSGGEPLLQAAFVAEVIDQLDGMHTLLDTCGYGAADDFNLLLARVDMVYYDLKLMDSTAHRRYNRLR